MRTVGGEVMVYTWNGVKHRISKDGLLNKGLIEFKSTGDSGASDSGNRRTRVWGKNYTISAAKSGYMEYTVGPGNVVSSVEVNFLRKN